MHSDPIEVGAYGWPSIFTTMPFSTYTRAGHAWMQPRHVVT